MTDREKITEILKNYTKKNNISASSVILEEYAEELIANGVIVPPCKVGDTVYSLMGGFAEEMKVNRLMLTLKPNNEHPIDFIREFDDFGKTVFLTKEEAEEKLRGLQDNDK